MSGPQERGYALSLRILGALAVLLRLVFVLFVHPPRNFVFSDMESYDYVARELLAGQTNPWQVFRPVGYSMLLALVYLLTDFSRTFVGVLQALMGGLLAPWSAELARAAGASKLTALLVGLVVATSVPLMLYCGLLLTEIPSAFFLMLALRLLMVREGQSELGAGRLFKAGLCLGVAGAVRPNFMLVFPVVAVYLGFALASAARRRPSTHASGKLGALLPWLALAAGLALPMGGVSAYNSHALGRAVGPSANGGLNFYMNFADVHTVHYQGALGQYWVSPVPNGLSHTRLEQTEVPLFNDRYYYARGLRHIRERPEALREALANFPEVLGIGRQLMWPNWPGQERLLRGYALGFFWLVLAPALASLGLLAYRALRRRAQPEALAVAALCAANALPIYFFLGDPRVRVPFDPLFAVLAGLGCEALVLALVRRFSPRAVTPDAPSLG